MVNNIGSRKLYVDASYAIHDDCKGHTAALMTMRGGAITSFLRKQNVNAKGSTEAELIGMNYDLPQILLTRYFIECQQYKIDSIIVYQANRSTVVLEQKREEAGSTRAKHIKVRHFFIKEKIAQREIEVKYCPTEKMWSDGMIKPQQGQVLMEMRAIMMNCPTDYDESSTKQLQKLVKTQNITMS